MSIRLRFTLLYSAILTVTLLIFGVSLYYVQAQDTLNFLKENIIQSSGKVTESLLRPGGKLPFREGDRIPVQEPEAFGEFSDEKTFQDLREREIVRILDQDGNLMASPNGNVEDALPLSNEGLSILQDQEFLWETGEYDEEEMLIYSYPVVQNEEITYIVQIARPLTERNQTLSTLATTLGVAGFIVVLLAFAVGWVFSGITLQPIHRITQTAQTIGDERDFTRRVDYTGPPDEVGQLASTFNSMLSRLQDAYEKAEHSLELQRNFVADVSHELRTPLTTLRGNLGLLSRKPAAEMQNDILVDMVDESDRMIRLVNDLLLLARADAGRSLAKEPVDVSSMLEETVRQARQLDAQREISLDAATSLMVMGDRDAIKQVFLIALDNALKHSSGEVIVTAKQNGAQVEIRVQDFGEGISPEILEHVFDRFYRSEDSSTIPGFGLGLAIAKTLIEGMGGEISMQSEKGKGSTVIVCWSC